MVQSGAVLSLRFKMVPNDQRKTTNVCLCTTPALPLVVFFWTMPGCPHKKIALPEAAQPKQEGKHVHCSGAQTTQTRRSGLQLSYTTLPPPATRQYKVGLTNHTANDYYLDMRFEFFFFYPLWKGGGKGNPNRGQTSTLPHLPK